ncbi:blue light receptor [Ceratobasidium sp. 392]|nr:blue light receptor [Ceratobasidium sp. 392]
MEDFSTYLTSTPPEVQSQSAQQQLAQPSMQDQMAAHHQQQQTMLQQSQSAAWHASQQAQAHQQHQHQQQAQQAPQQQQQVPMGPFAYPPPTAQSTPSSAAPQSHNLTPRSFAEAMGIDPNAFTNEIAFQLPSFLTGPTVAPGGGGDVIPGSASNLQQPDSYSNSWYAGGAQNSHASGYHVGFQVDLVDQPHAILQTMRDGSYIVNYSLQSNPQPALSPGRDKIGLLNPELRRIIANTMSTGGFGAGDEQERQDLNMMLLENSDDFIHVLSLKGSFLYVSPSVRHILEYDPEELIGKSISDVTHPSDIVPVMRELKESSTIVPSGSHGGSVQKTVNLLLRVRRKTSGYVWIESQGRLHVEPGKGRKAIILSGRKKEVPLLQWSSIARAGGLGDKEFWVQMSVDGLVLVASAGVHEIMGYTPDEFLGTNLIVDHILEEWKPSILGHLASAISPTRAITMASEAARRPDAGLDASMPEIARCVLITKHGQKISSDVCFYPPLASMDDGAPGSAPAIKRAPASLVCQIKVVSPDMMGRPRSQTTGSLDLGGAGPSTGMFGGRMTGEPLSSGITGQLQGRIVHDLSSNVYEELETTRSTSWQYELQQLKISNKRMKDEVDSIVERMSNPDVGVDKSRKRRTRDNPEGDQL